MLPLLCLAGLGSASLPLAPWTLSGAGTTAPIRLTNLSLPSLVQVLSLKAVFLWRS